MLRIRLFSSICLFVYCAVAFDRRSAGLKKITLSLICRIIQLMRLRTIIHSSVVAGVVPVTPLAAFIN